MAIPFLLLALAAVGGNVVQHRLVWSAEPLKPKLSKISPAAGLKRLFSKQALANFVKGLVKLASDRRDHGDVAVARALPARQPGRDRSHSDIAARARRFRSRCSARWLPCSRSSRAADYLFQYRQWYERQKMSLRELKDEFKQTEGDPAVKGKIRQIRQARMRKRMMAAVPKASVVITNPTHFAVALQYERGMTAPVCVAKGADADRAEDPRNCDRARHSDRRKSAAGARTACARSKSTRKSRPSTIRPWRRSSAMSCGSIGRWLVDQARRAPCR